MKEKEKKFITIAEAVDEICHDFRSYPNQYDLFSKIYTFLVGGKAVPGEEKCPPFNIIYGGIWYQPQNCKEKTFYSLQDFNDLLVQAFDTKIPSVIEVAELYTMVMGVKAYVDKSQEDNQYGIWVDTEMEKFKCKQCGNCCLNLSGACSRDADEEDMTRWEEEGRVDILKYIYYYELWYSPRTGEELDRCPWLRKLPQKNKYICRIHDTKPTHCKQYPKSKKHALSTDCEGFSTKFK